MKSVSTNLSLLLVLLCLCVGLSAVRAGQSVAVAWDQSSDSDISYYALYYGEVGRGATNRVASAGTTSTLDLVAGKSYFAFATTVSTSGTESQPSNLLTYTVPSTGISFVPVSTQTVQEGNPLSFGLMVASPDPTKTLTFALVSGPAGAALNPASGVFSWTPTEAQGPGSYTISVQVNDSSIPSSVAITTFVVSVTEANTPPTLAAVADQTVAEGNTLSVKLIGNDLDLPANNLTYTLVSGPAGAAVDAATGMFSWKPAVGSMNIAVTTATVQVSDNQQPPLTAQTSFNIGVTKLNTAPVLATIADQQISEGTALTVQLTATDAESATGLIYSLVSGPQGSSVNSATGVFSWTPTEAQGPSSALVTVQVSDTGSPALTATKTFVVTVKDVNSAPVLAAVSNQFVTEGSTLLVNLTATDADLPANVLAYSLVSGPAGMTVDTIRGTLTWVPTELQGLSTNVVTVRVSDNGTPALSATATFTVVVGEANRAPVLTPIGEQRISAGQVFMFALTATDSDLPANKLTYRLVSAPSGMSLDSTTGVLTWRLSKADPSSTNLITVSVSDNGVPSMSDAKSFSLIVAGKGSKTAGANVRVTGLHTLRWSAETGTAQSVQFAHLLPNNMQGGLWIHHLEASQDLRNWVEVGSFSNVDELKDESASSASMKFYRVRSEAANVSSGSAPAKLD